MHRKELICLDLIRAHPNSSFPPTHPMHRSWRINVPHWSKTYIYQTVALQSISCLPVQLHRPCVNTSLLWAGQDSVSHLPVTNSIKGLVTWGKNTCGVSVTFCGFFHSRAGKVAFWPTLVVPVSLFPAQTPLPGRRDESQTFSPPWQESSGLAVFQWMVSLAKEQREWQNQNVESSGSFQKISIENTELVIESVPMNFSLAKGLS